MQLKTQQQQQQQHSCQSDIIDTPSLHIHANHRTRDSSPSEANHVPQKARGVTFMEPSETNIETECMSETMTTNLATHQYDSVTESYC